MNKLRLTTEKVPFSNKRQYPDATVEYNGRPEEYEDPADYCVIQSVTALKGVRIA